MSESFIPPMEPMGGVAPVFWRYNPILPLVFTYELTYMEQVASVCKKLNDIAESSNKQGENVQRLYDAYVALENSVMGRTGAWVVASMLVDGIINTAKLANGAVTGEKLANGSVDTQHIADGAITHDKLADHCVDQRHIDPGAVNSSQIAGGAILPEHLGENLKSTIDRITGLFSGSTGMGGAVLRNLGDPVQGTDAATKQYAEDLVRNRFSTMLDVGLYFQNRGGGVCTYIGEEVDATNGTQRMLCVADSFTYGKWSFWAITKDCEVVEGSIDLATGKCTLF